MNFVGKLLVIVIMIFSLAFMGLTTVVFMTAENWKNKAGEAQAQLKKAEDASRTKDQDLEKGKADLAAVQKQLDEEKARHKGEYDSLVAIRDALETQKKDLETQRQVTQQTMELAQGEAKHRIAEANELRDKLKKTQDDANNLQREKTDLNATIFDLSRKLATSTKQNKELREDKQAALAFIQEKGFKVDLAGMKGLSLPPPGLEGIIRRADDRNTKAEISIGSDDGLRIGHELYIYSKNPSSYKGKLRITGVDADQAVGEVVGGKTVLGKRLQEGDIVSATLPRGN